MNCVRWRTVDGWRAYTDNEHGLLVTASGDQSAHVWRAPLTRRVPDASTLDNTEDSTVPTTSSDDDLDVDDDDDVALTASATSIRTPCIKLTGHSAAVIGADWLSNGTQIITASWDRTANVYDAERGDIVQTLTGHDQELTYTHAHPSARLVVTASKDSTFRLWDFRDTIHSVAVFQGHTEYVLYL